MNPNVGADADLSHFRDVRRSFGEPARRFRTPRRCWGLSQDCWLTRASAAWLNPGPAPTSEDRKLHFFVKNLVIGDLCVTAEFGRNLRDSNFHRSYLQEGPSCSFVGERGVVLARTTTPHTRALRLSINQRIA